MGSGQNADGGATSGGTEDFASKILLEMRGRKGEEVRLLFSLSVGIWFVESIAGEILFCYFLGLVRNRHPLRRAPPTVEAATSLSSPCED